MQGVKIKTKGRRASPWDAELRRKDKNRRKE
jgi:hypothetical protein